MMRTHRLLPFALLGSIFAVACASDSGKSSDAGNTQAPTFTQITQDVITTPSCGGPFCHSAGAAGFMLGATLYSELVGQTASGSKCGMSGLKRVVAGDPDHSLLYMKLHFDPPCGDGMPVTGALDAAKVEMVRQWIAAGAKND